MNFRHESIRDFLLHDTQVENMFISEYLPGADGLALKVYLTALMYAGRAEISNELIARQLSISVEEVLQAWNYWEEVGVIRRHYLDPGDRFHYVVEFLNLRDRLYGTMPAGGTDMGAGRGSGSEAGSVRGFRDQLDEDGLRQVFDSVQEITGRMLEGREPDRIISWVIDDGVDKALISYVYRYCVQRDKNNFGYVSAVMESWIRQDIRTVEDAEKYLSETDERHNRYRRIMKALGFHRNATEEEQRKIDSWFDELGFGIDRVLDACARTSGISSPNINYVNSILLNWAKGQNGPAEGGAGAPVRGSSQSIAARVKKVYEEIRNRQRAELESRRDEAFRRAPRLEEIEGEEHRLYRIMTKIALSGGNFGGMSTADAQTKMDDLYREKIGILGEMGLPGDFLDMHYECGRCKDTGLLDDGSRCSCFTEKMNRFV